MEDSNNHSPLRNFCKPRGPPDVLKQILSNLFESKLTQIRIDAALSSSLACA